MTGVITAPAVLNPQPSASSHLPTSRNRLHISPLGPLNPWWLMLVFSRPASRFLVAGVIVFSSAPIGAQQQLTSAARPVTHVVKDSLFTAEDGLDILSYNA